MMQSDHSVIRKFSQHTLQFFNADRPTRYWQALLPARGNWAGWRILHTDRLAVEDNFRVGHDDDARGTKIEGPTN